MKKLLTLFLTGAAIAALTTACNDVSRTESGLGEEIPGIETIQATGTIIGKFQDHAFGSFLVQVDEGFPIGETLEHHGLDSYTKLPEAGTYDNMIQVQHKLPFEVGNRISFSCREYKQEVDFWSLFVRGRGATTADHIQPQVPICVITEYKLLNN